MNRQTQIISKLEKAEYLNNLKNKAEYDICLYYHYESIKAELKEEFINN